MFTEFLAAETIVSLRNWIEESVRAALKLPFSEARPALRYEHSMGQRTNLALPSFILRRSATDSPFDRE